MRPLPEYDGPEELLYDSERTRVVRVRPAGASTTVIRKRPLGPGAAERLRNELAMLQLLDGVAGTPRLTRREQSEDALDFVDVPGQPLATLPSPWDVGPLLDLAYGLAEALAAIHRHGVVHRDVSPANILVPTDGGAPTLIDFELATTLSEDRFKPVPGDDLAGTLPYLAPEQTGRTGRPVDHRADLYALGATLYELETGEPPFGRDRDPLRLVHDHLARVPSPPAELNPHIPVALSEITLRLLRKEPERRYQSGEGLAYDLARLRETYGRGATPAFPLGERDFPMRLAAPSRLVGRDNPLATLHGLFAESVAGHRGVALITGPPGVGKTALVDRLRPAISQAGGRFVSGKFDQYRRADADAVRQAFTALGALLLTEPDDEVARLRAELLEALGPNAGLIAHVLPTFAAVLGVEPDEAPEDNPQRLVVRIRRAGLNLMRVIARGDRPLVMFIDDLQWAGPAAFGFLDDVLGEPELAGVLVLGAYREAEVDETHPLTAVLARMRRTGGMTREMRLDNLGQSEISTLLSEMLRLPMPEAEPLAEALSERTAGNPFDTVELVNALRKEGALVPEGAGWRWDPGTLRRFVGRGDVVDLLAARIEALPAATRELLSVMACLSCEVDLELLRIASGMPADQVAAGLLPAAEDGLVSISRDGSEVASFRHDRVQQAAYARIDPETRARLSLDLARRLSALPEYALAAAQQYLGAVGVPFVPAERETAAKLLRQAAASARTVALHNSAESYLGAALRILEPGSADYDETRAEWHTALCSLGRFDEADAVYRDIEASTTDPVWLAGPAGEQIAALTSRGMLPPALELGLALLTRLGFEGPGQADLSEVHAWLATPESNDLERPELVDPRLVAAVRVMNRSMPAAFFVSMPTMAWLIQQCLGLWVRDGTSAELIGPLGNMAFLLAAAGEIRAGYDSVRRLVAVGSARGWEPGTSQAKMLHGLSGGPSFVPLERSVHMLHEAREGLLRGGDLMNAASTYIGSIPQMLDSAPTLEEYATEVEAGLALCEKIGFGHGTLGLLPYRQLARAMRGETAVPGRLGDADFDEAAHLAQVLGEPANASFEIQRALAAAIYGDDDEALIESGASALQLQRTIPGTYLNTVANTVAALAAAARARNSEGEERAAALADLDRSREFLAARAAGHVGNFRHLYLLTEALTAELTGEVRAAAIAFDRAVSDAAQAQRPWHAALIAERAGIFFRREGFEHLGRLLLGEAAEGYAAWGAHGKVRAMERTYAFLTSTPVARPSAPSRSSVNLSTEALDLLAVLEAARVLSSETDLGRLRLRVEQVLSAMTGATAVHVVLRDEHSMGWVLPADAITNRPELGLAEAAQRGFLPLTAFRYAERTREPMLVDDASRDDRVARDPYLSGLEHCSLLVVPVLSQGMPRAMLILENRLTRRAFTVGRLDAVMLIAGQLTVSLDNALVYASLERKVAERTEELAEANHRLELLTVTDPLTGLANRRRLTDVLDAEWLRAQRPGTPVGLAMIDIDNFKTYNDHYGHQGGDECLRLVARTLRGSLRATDLVARYGGEEFCIVMPGADRTGALAVAERACRAVADLKAPHALAEIGIVTISVGVTAAVPLPGSDSEQLIKVADEALYVAKRSGRNRVVAA